MDHSIKCMYSLSLQPHLHASFPRCSNCAAVLQAVEEEILRANNLKSDSLKDQERMEQESKQLRQTLMKMSASSSLDPEEDQQFASQKQSKKGLAWSLYCNVTNVTITLSVT